MDKPEEAIDAMKAVAVTPKALVLVDIVVAKPGPYEFRLERTHVRTVPLRRVANVSHFIDLDQGQTRESRDAVAASLEISLIGPEETIWLPFSDEDFGGDLRARVNAINTVAAKLTEVLT